MGTAWNDIPWFQNNKHILSDFHKKCFLLIIQFLTIIHSYNQDYVDQEDNTERMGHSLKNVIWEKVKIPERKHFISMSSDLLLHTTGQWEK